MRTVLLVGLTLTVGQFRPATATPPAVEPPVEAPAPRGHFDAELADVRTLLTTDQPITPALRTLADRSLPQLRAAAADQVAAQTLLGLCYHTGVGVPKDAVRAVEYWRIPASAGEPVAQLYLAEAFANGMGVPRAVDEEIRWLSRAAETGLPEAQLRLGVAYEHGEGVPKSPEQAFRFYQLAADAGHPVGKVYLGDLYAWGTGVGRDPAKAKWWIQQAADTGHAMAQKRLGDLYLAEGVPSAASNWYRKAAEQGYADAQVDLGVLLATRERPNFDAAAYWLRKAADQDRPDAAVWLTAILHVASGLDRSPQGVAFYRDRARRTLGPEKEEGEFRRAVFAIDPIGQPAPDFAYLRDGKPVKLSDLRGKVVLVWFSDTGCGPARQLARYLPDVRMHLEPQSVEVVFVEITTDPEPARIFHLRFVPRMYVLDEEGVCRSVLDNRPLYGTGFIRLDTLQEAVDPLLKSNSLSTPNVPPRGIPFCRK